MSESSAVTVLDSLAAPVMVVDCNLCLSYANAAAQQFFRSSLSHLNGLALTVLLQADESHPLVQMVDQVRHGAAAVHQQGIVLDTLRTGACIISAQASPLADESGAVVLSLHEQSLALRVDSRLAGQTAARSAAGLADLLAHEVKNPLAGIRGAAQLLQGSVTDSDRPLAQLIVDEVDRIAHLVERLDVLSDKAPVSMEAINIHAVLGHVCRLASSGWARNIKIREIYDPSLPDVWGNRNQLVQLFLNLVKNAAEAVPERGGEITLTTSCPVGVRLPSDGARPLMVSVADNGSGVAEVLRPRLFDAFVSDKLSGTGLGLALAAKIVATHGGLIEFDSIPKQTVFRVMLPMVAPSRDAES